MAEINKCINGMVKLKTISKLECTFNSNNIQEQYYGIKDESKFNNITIKDKSSKSSNNLKKLSESVTENSMRESSIHFRSFAIIKNHFSTNPYKFARGIYFETKKPSEVKKVLKDIKDLQNKLKFRK